MCNNRMRNYLLFFIFLLPPFYTNAQSGRYKFKLIFHDGHSEFVKSRIYYNPQTHRNYLIDNREKIYPDATDSLLRLSHRHRITGYPFTDTWLFKVIDGDLSCLTYLPDKRNSSIAVNLAHGFLHQKGDTVLTPYSKKKLEKILNSKPKAWRYYKNMRIVNTNSLLIGCIGLAGGIGVALVSNFDVAIWGARIAILSVPMAVPFFMTCNYKVRAIKKYNAIQQSGE